MKYRVVAISSVIKEILNYTGYKPEKIILTKNVYDALWSEACGNNWPLRDSFQFDGVTIERGIS